jgi:hypothetical protein
MEVKCPSCASKRILRRGRIVSQGLLGRFAVSVEIPASTGLPGRITSAMSASVCVDCGNMVLVATDLENLRRAYDAVGKPLGLET